MIYKKILILIALLVLLCNCDEDTSGEKELFYQTRIENITQIFFHHAGHYSILILNSDKSETIDELYSSTKYGYPINIAKFYRDVPDGKMAYVVLVKNQHNQTKAINFHIHKNEQFQGGEYTVQTGKTSYITIQTSPINP